MPINPARLKAIIQADPELKALADQELFATLAEKLNTPAAHGQQSRTEQEFGEKIHFSHAVKAMGKA